MNRIEQTHCVAFMDWVNFQSNSIPELRTILHIPNEGKRSVVAGAILKRMGLRPGAYDYVVPVPRLCVDGLRAGLIIEFKSPDAFKKKNNGLSPEQVQWRDMMHAHGFMSVVVKDWVDAKEYVLTYLGVIHQPESKRH